MMTGTLGRSALTFGSISRPLMPGMLISDKIRISDGSGIAFTCSSAAGADKANSMTKRPERRSRRKCWRKRNNKLGKNTRLGVDVNSAAVLLHDDVVRHRETEASSFTGWLRCEER